MSFIVNNVPLNAPVGSIVAYVNSTPPSGWLLCDGTSIPDGTSYQSLRDFLGTTTTPDLKAFFLRGTGSAPNIYDIPYIGPNVRNIALDTIRQHNHIIYYSDDDKDGGGNSGRLNSFTVVSLIGLTNTSGSESRPINYGIIWIIKA